MKFQPRTRGGYDYRILADDLPGELPIAMWVDYPTASGGAVVRLNEQGRQVVGLESTFDLLPAPQEVWVNIYEDGSAEVLWTKADAVNIGPGKYPLSARKRLPYNPGEFDE